MKARVPSKTYLEEEIDKAVTQTRLETIKACMVSFVASLNIADNLKEERNITFEWIGEESQ